MPKEYPYFKFWAKDWSTDETIKLMSRQAKGLYIDMLVHCWIEGSLPADTKSLCKLFGCRKNAFVRLFGEFSTHFLRENDRFVCPKLKEQFDLVSQKSAILAENGRKGGSKSKANGKQLLKQKQSITESESESESESYKDKNKQKDEAKLLRVFDHYIKIFNKTKGYDFNRTRKKLIKDAFKRAHSEEILIKAIDSMALDDWSERVNHNDLKYAIGITRGIDNVLKWAEFKPQSGSEKKFKNIYETKGKDYGETRSFRLK